MKIAFLASPVTPLMPAQAGGAQAALCDVATGLARRGHDVAVFCAEGSRVPGVKVVSFPRPSDAAAALVMPLGPPPPSAPGVAAAIRAMFAAIREHRPEVVSQHAFDAAAFEAPDDLRTLHTLHLPPIVPAVVDAVSRVPARCLAAVSASSRAEWLGAGVEVGRVLHNGVEDLEVDRETPDRRALIAGRLSPEKGVEHALAAARRAGLDIRVAGAHYDPAYAPNLGDAELLGQLTRHDLRRVMARSAVTICAVRWDEPFGLVAAEAQMAGCPVAAYRRGAMPEVVEEGVSGFLAPPDDIAALAAAVEACLGLDRRQVRASARRRLDLGRTIDAYEAALREVAS
jgi:UDP-glucose:tetrahydrobiopterin glucosyltransferase